VSAATITGVHKGNESEQSASTVQMLGKCDRLRKELSRAYAANPRNAGYIRRLADEINVVEGAMAASQCEVSAQLGAAFVALDDKAVDRMFVAPNQAADEAQAPAIDGCESKDRSGQHT